MQDVVFGHRDTVGRLPDKLDFNCDILEKKGEFLITADLPGLAKDQVNITVDDDRRLHISAERASRHEEVSNKGTFLVYEVHPEVPVRSSIAHRLCVTSIRRFTSPQSPRSHLYFYFSQKSREKNKLINILLHCLSHADTSTVSNPSTCLCFY